LQHQRAAQLSGLGAALQLWPYPLARAATTPETGREALILQIYLDGVLVAEIPQ